MIQKVLIVDDEDDIREFLAVTLQEDGYEACVAADGYEALRQFRSENPDLLIIDLLMPRMNGYELCRRIRESSSVPIAVTTGLGQQEEAQATAFSVGADVFLNKPFSTQEFLDQVHALLACGPERLG